MHPVVQIISSFLNSFSNLLRFFVDVLTSLVEAILDPVSNVVCSLFYLFTSFFDHLSDVVAKVFDSLANLAVRVCFISMSLVATGQLRNMANGRIYVLVKIMVLTVSTLWLITDVTVSRLLLLSSLIFIIIIMAVLDWLITSCRAHFRLNRLMEMINSTKSMVSSVNTGGLVLCIFLWMVEVISIPSRT